MDIPTDPNGRRCGDCHESFFPQSMTRRGLPVVRPPVEYQCLSCRSLSKAAG